jgi:hypothetical protein
MIMILKARAAMIVSLFMAMNIQFESVSGALRGQFSEQQQPAGEAIHVSNYGSEGEIVQNLKLLPRQLATRAGHHVANGINGTNTVDNDSIVNTSALSNADRKMAMDVYSNPVNIMNFLNGKCIDSNDRSAKRLIMYDCHGWDSDGNQVFYRPQGSGGPIQLYGTNLCLDAYGRTAGSGVGLWNCHGGENQKWSFYPGSLTLRPSFDRNLCLVISNGDSGNNALLGIWYCDGNKNSQWSSLGGGACTRSYFVSSGETCDSIGRKFGVSGNSIISSNYGQVNSGCTNLQVGQVLCIP